MNQIMFVINVSSIFGVVKILSCASNSANIHQCKWKFVISGMWVVTGFLFHNMEEGGEKNKI
jgi:hypothetical protein